MWDLEDVAVADGGRLKDDADDVVGVVVAGRLAAGLDAPDELGRQQAAVRAEVHRLPLLLLQQHVRHVLVPVDCAVAVRVHFHEDLLRHAYPHINRLYALTLYPEQRYSPAANR